MNIGKEINAGAPGEFLSFEETINYSEARKRVPWAVVIARTFGGYIAFRHIDDYHRWMLNR